MSAPRYTVPQAEPSEEQVRQHQEALDRHFRRTTREPKPMRELTRPELCARIASLRFALDVLVGQEETDGGEAYRCRGAMKKVLMDLEDDLRARDKAADQGEPLPVEVALAMVSQQEAR